VWVGHAWQFGTRVPARRLLSCRTLGCMPALRRLQLTPSAEERSGFGCQPERL
jgi:hypothetical protein